MQRPPSIILFERLFWSSTLVSIVTTFITWNEMATAFDREAGVGRSSGSFGVVFVILVISLAIVFALWYAIARRGSNVAKWIYVVLTAIGALQTIAGLFNPDGLGTLSRRLAAFDRTFGRVGSRAVPRRRRRMAVRQAARRPRDFQLTR